MEVMEEGNLMDRVPILLQRDLQYYQTHQCVLQECLCLGVVGGKLDFPRYASFAAIKIILWWEDEYFASYRKHSGLLHTEKELSEGDFSAVVIKSSDPDKFVSLVTKSADMLLEHLHVLSQESLDHADLSVLTATIGAAALVRNCLNVYLQAASTTICPPKGDEKGGALKISFKQYSQLSEALAERLLDLHCRLLLLYIVQDADALHWEDAEAFFESERGSYCIQMWWLYMYGTKNDLWNSVPPKMAQRIFGGMLNETLSVLTIRYSQITTSLARAQLHLCDMCNLLFCIAELLPHVCESGEAYVGLQLNNQSVIIRDIHAKCRELFYCLLLRGAPLGVLSKVFRKGLENMEMFASRHGLPSAWIIFALPRLFPKEQSCQWVTEFADLNTSSAVSLELKVLLSSPEADWSFLVKVLLMRDAHLTGIILKHLLKHLPSNENFKNVAKHAFIGDTTDVKKCEGFLCRGECFNVADLIADDLDPVGQTNCQIVLSLTYLLVAMGKAVDIKKCLIAALEDVGLPGWSDCLDKRQVWNQKRPPWLEAIMHFVYPVLDCIVEMLVNAVEAGASMYQAMSLALTCVSEMYDCIPEGLYKVTSLLQDIIPVTTRALSDSVLMQVMFAALYTELIKHAEKYEALENDAKATVCYTLSEAICSIDEDDKHTDQIELFLKQVFRKGLENMEMFASRHGLPSAWIIFALPRLFPKEQSCQWVTEFADLNTSSAVSLELKVLLSSPEADWSFLVKVLLMRDAHLTGIILKHLLKHLPSNENFKNVAKHAFIGDTTDVKKCEGFLCRGECFNVADLIADDLDPVGQTNCQIVLSLTYLLVAMGKAVDIKKCLIAALEDVGLPGWSDCLDKRQVWNQKRPPWLEAIMHFVYPVLDCIVEMLVNAVEAGASMYQAMSLALTCVSEMYDCIPEGLYKVTSLLQDIIPVTTRALSDSVLMQVMFAALYTELIKHAEKYEALENDAKATVCYTLSEAICSIDEDDKHTDQIELFLKQANDSIILDSCSSSGRGQGGMSAVSTIKIDDIGTSDSDRLSHSPPANYAMELEVGITDFIAEVLTSDVLTTDVGKQALKVCYNYLKNNKDWLREQLDATQNELSPFQGVQGQQIKETKPTLLTTMFFIENTPFDQLLAGSLKIDYVLWLQTPLSLNPERAWLQLARRCDFQENNKLTMPEVAMVASIQKVMKKRKTYGK